MATLYRYYDDGGRLLYAGRTGRGLQRFSSHVGDAPWWRLVHFAEFHQVEDRNIGLAERLVIWVEQPLFNRSLRVTTESRQAMLARLAEQPEPLMVDSETASRILRLSRNDIRAAIRWGFLKSEYPRANWMTHEALREFIGDFDPGPADARALVGYRPSDYYRRLTGDAIHKMRGPEDVS